jgi:AcrR family transcriptional regulator
MNTGHGLRERKKLATRAALSRAALRLAIDNGLDSVTPDAIAEAAEVSPRTFRNYFSSKEEAIVAGLLHGSDEAAAALRARPAGEPVWESLRQVVPPYLQGAVADRRQIVALTEMVRVSPPLLAHLLAAYETVSLELAEAIAERTGTDAERDSYPHLLAGVVTVAMKVAVDEYAKQDNTLPLAQLVEEALAQLSRGLPVPGSGNAGSAPPATSH